MRTSTSKRDAKCVGPGFLCSSGSARRWNLKSLLVVEMCLLNRISRHRSDVLACGLQLLGYQAGVLLSREHWDAWDFVSYGCKD